jgi:hypothetical protein
MVALFLLFVLLQVADGYTTYRLLSAGGKELNPLLAYAFDRIGLVPGLVIYKGVCVAGGGWLYLSQQWWIIAALLMFYLWVVWHNVQQMRM